MAADSKVLADKIAHSKADVAKAESELSRLLQELTGTPRAEKTTITDAVRAALATLRSARVELEDLSRIVAAKD